MALRPEDSRGGLVEEEGRLEIDFVLKIPIGLGDLVDAVTAHQHRGGADEHVEIAGQENKIEAFIDLMRPYGIIELARTGRIALTPLPGTSLSARKSKPSAT